MRGRIRASWLALLVCLALPALPLDVGAQTPPAAGDPPIDADRFEAMTQGKTFDTHSYGAGFYGVETFFPDRRVYWRDAQRCVAGYWDQVGEQICFTYEDKADRPVCWTYHDRGDWLMGWRDGDRASTPIMLYPAGKPAITCDDFIGS